MERAKMCKNNMKLYPIHSAISCDFLFFYTINVLFLTQIKNFNISTVVLVDSFYSLFFLIFQIPANYILERTSRKKSLVLGSFFNCVYLILFICSNNVFTLIFAEIFCAFGFALKEISDPSMLNSSIPVTKNKSEIFSKLASKGLSSYYMLNSISLIISGILFNINGYIPIILSFIICFIALLLSMCYIDPLDYIDKDDLQIESIGAKNEGFKYIFKSGRLKSLIFFSAIMSTLLSLLVNLEVSMVEELKISSTIIGFSFAFLELISSISAKKQKKFHDTFRNKSLSVLGILISLSCLLSTIGFFFKFPIIITFVIIIISYSINRFVSGIYYVLLPKYLSNFTNEEIDSKIYMIRQFVGCIVKIIFGVAFSCILEKLPSYKTMLILGFTFLLLFLVVIIYMKNKLGLSPEKYPDEETKYSVLKKYDF